MDIKNDLLILLKCLIWSNLLGILLIARFLISVRTSGFDIKMYKY